MTTTPYGDSTRCVQAGLGEPQVGQPFLPGPTFASIYVMDSKPLPEPGVDTYGRPDSPTRRRLEAAIGELEGGEAVAFASGMSAVTSLLLTLVSPGERVLIPADGYYGTRAWAGQALAPRGITVDLVPTVGPYPDFAGARLVLLESPGNPGLDVCDIAELAATAHAAGALVAVDNTTATPLGQRPLDLGADLVVASGTKALTGHSDVLLGYVAARDPQLLGAIRAWRNTTGAIPGDFDAWLSHRSLATLDLRLARQSANAAALAEVLAAHPAVLTTRWPGRAEDPAAAVAAKQMQRMPGVVTFTLADAEQVARFFDAAAVIKPATSFGGLHTTADRRAQWGDAAPPGLVRLSCGIEDTDDLVRDIRQALDVLGG
jgi:cystathionine gamma-lyase